MESSWGAGTERSTDGLAALPDFFRAADADAFADADRAARGARLSGADAEVRPPRDRGAAEVSLAATVSEAAADPAASAGSAQAGVAAPNAAAPIPSATARPPTRPIKADACIPGHLPTCGRGAMANEQPRPPLTISRFTLRENSSGIRFRCQVIFCRRTGQIPAATWPKSSLVSTFHVKRGVGITGDYRGRSLAGQPARDRGPPLRSAQNRGPRQSRRMVGNIPHRVY